MQRPMSLIRVLISLFAWVRPMEEFLTRPMPLETRPMQRPMSLFRVLISQFAWVRPMGAFLTRPMRKNASLDLSGRPSDAR
jgi:hypothetical protein